MWQKIYEYKEKIWKNDTSSAQNFEQLKVFRSDLLLSESKSCDVVFDNVSHLLNTSRTGPYDIFSADIFRLSSVITCRGYLQQESNLVIPHLKK